MSPTCATALFAVKTAVPPYRGTQEQAAQFMRRVLTASLPEANLPRALGMVDKIYTSSGIHTRQSVVNDWLAEDPSQFTFFPANWQLEPFPSTAARMKVYEQASVDLAEQAARAAMIEAGIAPGEVTHLVISTCTGFFAPGPDILLLRRLGLRPTVSRAILGFMGCYAGFNGMRMADQIVRSDAGAVVLHVCIELCTLHFQKKATPDLLIANCLFSDGCSAAVFGAKGRRPALALLAASHSHVEGDSLDQMTWHIGDTGFEMRLSVQVPRTLEQQAAPFVESLLTRAGMTRQEVATWAVHPGGRKIVESLASALKLGEDDLAPSYGVLHDYGNMSSATIYFVLDRRLRDGGPSGPVVALGFGPGLTMEGAVLVRE